ncbi:MAG: fused MFS/spermidine synthase, partial [Methanosarcinaceae archaeon]|nr:fused MFS/spermidine synthase [Methanosarcinaceae archaeon]
IYALSIITASFLIGLSIGSFIMSKYIHKINYPITTFAFIELGIGLFVIFMLFFIDKLDILYLTLYHNFNSFYPFIISLLIVIFLITLIPTTLMGTTMPIVSRIISKKFKCVGTDIGVIYTTNTFGAIFGTFFATFVLIPTIGITKTGAIGAAISIIIALLIFTNSEQKWKTKFYPLAASSILLCIYLATVTINPLFAGAYYHGTQMPDVEAWKYSKDSIELIHYEEGLYGLVSVVKQDEYITLRIDGKSESSDVPIELVTEYQIAYIPLFARSNIDDVMLIGLGGGFTLDAITNFDEIKTIDIIEINPRIIDVTKEHFSSHNNNALDDPRINLIIDDARNTLASEDTKYDVIISQPSNIWLSGEGGLFTKEMYEIAKDDLKRGGIFCQWIPLYETDNEDFKIFLATFESVFPHTALWIVGYDAVIVGSTEPIEYDYGRIRDHIASNTNIRSDFEMMSDVLVTQGKYRLLYQMIVPYRLSDKSVQEFAGNTINTDDHPILEFTTARNTIYYQNTDKPLDALGEYMNDRFDQIITPPFTNLTKRYDDHIELNFIDCTIGLDRTWTQNVAQINVDHRTRNVFMKAFYTQDHSQFSILAIPLPDLPFSIEQKENIILNMKDNAKTALLEEGEVMMDGFDWGYKVKTSSGNGNYNYAFSWFCNENDILYTSWLVNIDETSAQEILESIQCKNEAS